jgi:hypothetical protein
MPKLSAIAIALLTAGITLCARAAPASACSPARYDTPFDLFDGATTVAVMKATSVSKTSAELALVDVLKGTADPQLELKVGLMSTCSPSIGRKGQRGVVFLNDAGAMIGLYDGFQSDPKMVAALRVYATATTAADRATALLDLAVGKSHTLASSATYALANRIELVQALDAGARDRVIAKLETASEYGYLILVAARFHDPRVAALQERRGFERGVDLGGVIAGDLDGESDPAELARLMTAKGSSFEDRVAAFERCEQLRGTSLARFTEVSYRHEDNDDAEWAERASACHTGVPVP